MAWKARIRRPSPGTVLGGLALIVAMSGVAVAAIPSSDGVIATCFSKAQGTWRPIDAEAGARCKSGELQLDIYTKSGAEARFLGKTAKAADSDLLDGRDASEFLDSDIDDDGEDNTADNCVFHSNPEQADTDGDRIGDLCDDFSDIERDGIADFSDNCPVVANAQQEDSDEDGVGDACESSENRLDFDDDGVNNAEDNCPFVSNSGREDSDADDHGDACDSNNGLDIDDDGEANTVDNCVFHSNPEQADTDHDRIGDLCDVFSDIERDGIADFIDNCPVVSNPEQEDSDEDGVGDACESMAASSSAVADAGRDHGKVNEVLAREP